MNLKELVNQPNEQPLDQDEALFILHEYIKERKGVEVNPLIRTTGDLMMLNGMITYAVGWFRMNKFKA